MGRAICYIMSEKKGKLSPRPAATAHASRDASTSKIHKSDAIPLVIY